ncbi:MAG: DNA-processing protein DprA [Neisseriaceae bacterium]|nr:DNA-processing protein DprA [Neisseriaceae bacterium]
MDDTERYARVQLALTPYIGAQAYADLIQFYGSAKNALTAPVSAIATLGRFGKQAAKEWQQSDKAKRAADAALEWATQENCTLLLSSDENYPSNLHQGITAPPLLFARGKLELLQQNSLAIVGSRHATPQAMRIAHDFAATLSEQNITIISGMASGIDTAAHQGALKHSGSTIAVWGTGIDRIYPQNNQQLAYQIAEQGLILSEFPLGTRPLAGNFPRRNRIIAAQSQAVLIVEAALESGSLITARLAAEMGREVMAIPGSIDNPHSKGCHKLIKDGAKLVECVDDILNECPIFANFQHAPRPKTAPIHMPKTSKKPVQAACKPILQTDLNVSQTAPSTEKNEHSLAEQLLNKMGYDPIHPDQLAEQLTLPTSDIYATLLELELDGKIAALSGGRYQRI